MVTGEPKQRLIAQNRALKLKLYQFIKTSHKEKGWAISWMCQLAQMSRAAYYKWLNHKLSQREVRDQAILERILEIAKTNNGLFGSGKMTLALNNDLVDGEKPIYRRTVARIMCVNRIYSNKTKYKKQKRYTFSKPDQTAENVLNRDFNSEHPNEKWCIDVTEEKVPGTKQKLFICGVLDLYDRYIVSYSISNRNDTALVNSAIKKALKEFPDSHALLHSDRGFQFTRRSFTYMLKAQGMTQSMSRVSRCIDNGPMESWQGIIKEMRAVLYPNVSSFEEMKEAYEKTIHYYLYHDPQERFNGKTPAQVRAEAQENPEQAPYYPIKQSKKYRDYWKTIADKKNQTA